MAQGLISRDLQAPDYWQTACVALVRCDSRWRSLIETYPERALRSRGRPYETLLRSLVGQQISVKAADAVWMRLLLKLENETRPSAVLALSDETLREVGLSRQKMAYVRALSELELSGGLQLGVLDAFDDQACMAHLCQTKGIGPWTAQMFLIFGLRRPDVWPIDDIGLRKGISSQFLEGAPVGAKEALQFGEALKPWRTVATWYLWRSLDPGVVDY